MELENILGIMMSLMGIISLGFVVNANRQLPGETELKRITKDLIIIIVSLTLFSIWHTLRELFHWKKTYGEVVEYPEYLFIIVSYIMLLKMAKGLYDTAKDLGITKKE